MSTPLFGGLDPSLLEGKKSFRPLLLTSISLPAFIPSWQRHSITLHTPWLYLLYLTSQGWLNVDRYSSIETLLRVTAYVFRFIDALKGRHIGKESSVVTAEEIKRAENIWIQTVQQGFFERELNYLLKPAGARPLLLDQGTTKECVRL